MKKNKIEKYALDSVFDSTTFQNIEHLKDGEDPPDFILSTNTDFRIGVEITTYYRDASNARLYNIPNYMKSLFEGKGSYRHKDDIDNLKVEKVSIHDPDGTLKKENVPMIIRKTDPFINYIESLAFSIDTKNTKIEKSKHQLNRSNLIVLDIERRVDNVDKKDISMIIFHAKIRKALRQSPFNEIYLVTGLKDTKKDIVIPLKLNMFYQDIEMLLYTINTDFKRIRSTNTFAYLCVELFKELNDNHVIVNTDAKKLTIFKDQFSVVFDEENRKKNIIDYGNIESPNIKNSKQRQYKKAHIVIDRWKHYRKNYTVDNFISYESKEGKKK